MKTNGDIGEGKRKRTKGGGGVRGDDNLKTGLNTERM